MTVSHFKALLGRIKRQSQPRVVIDLECFGPDDGRAVVLCRHLVLTKAHNDASVVSH